MPLTPEQVQRYSRQTILPQIGSAGQEKLLNSRVLLVGAGGLGSPAALYLAAGGVGTIGLVDQDVVDSSNLQRQVLHSEAAVGTSKIASARERMLSLNSKLNLETHETRLTSDNAMEILSSYDVIIDGSDNFPTRYLTNDACVLLGKPNIYGAIYHFEGQASVFFAKEGPCYRCLFPEPPPAGAVPSCEEAGVLGVLPGIIGMIQATEAIKLLLGIGKTLVGRLLLYDALEMEFRTINLRKQPDCSVCGDNATVTKLIDYEFFCGANNSHMDYIEVKPEELKKRFDSGDKPALLDVRNADEYAAGHLPDAQLIPVSELPNRLAEVATPRDQELIVYCKKGGRSGKACGILKDAGFTNIINLSGGYDAYEAAAKP